MATRKTVRAGKETAAKKAPAKKAVPAKGPRSMPKEGKDPQGGLTAKGREFFNKKEGSHLRPGVQGPADTPEKMVRKGSFLRRHFAHPSGPMKNEKGEPTRLALSAHAWGEPVPDTASDAKVLARKGHELLEQYHAEEQKASAKQAPGKKSPGKKAAVKKPAVKQAVTKTPAKRAAVKRSSAQG